MDYFHYQQQALYVEEREIAALALQFGTPLYIYSRATLERHYRVFDEAFGQHPHRICYAVKANSNIAVLNLLTRLGSGFDIVSGGELARVLAAGGEAKKIVFSGVGKLEWEIEHALAADVFCFNIESKAELERLDQIARRMNKVAAIAIRVNPDIDAKTHPYIATGLKENKFGVAIDEALALYRQASLKKAIHIIGIGCHIGSQLLELEPFVAACRRLMELIKQLQQENINIQHMDVGGGLGVRYKNEMPASPADYVKALQSIIPSNLEIMIEPGRAIIANAGILVTRVEYIKETADKNFAIVDAGMNDFLRPALYSAEQEIISVLLHKNATNKKYDIVGPVCETADFLGKDCLLSLQAGDLVAIRTAGAYGFVMSSNYNTRTRAAEIMVDGKEVYLIRAREKIEELFKTEALLP